MATIKEVGVRMKVGATGLENLTALQRELRGSGAETALLDAKAAALGDELKRLAAEQGLIDKFERTKTEVAEAGAAMQATKTKASELGRGLSEAKAGADSIRQGLNEAKAASNEAGESYSAQRVRLAALADETRRLTGQQSLVAQFKAQKAAVLESAQALEQAQVAAQNLGRELADTEAPTKRQKEAFARARAEVQAADAAYTSQRLALQRLRGDMAQAGVASDDLAAAQTRIRQGLAATEGEMASGRAELQRLKQAQADAEKQVGALSRELTASESAIKRQEKALATACKEARAADEAYTSQRLALQRLRTDMTQAGLSADDLAAAQVRVRKELAAAQAEVQQTTAWAQRMTTAQRTAAGQAEELGDGARRSAAGIRQQTDAVEANETALQRMGAQLRNLASIGVAGVLGSQTAQVIGDVTRTADEFSNLQARIRLVTGEGPAFEAGMKGISQVALATHSALGTTGDLFARLAASGKELGLGQESALALTQAINQSVQLSGASAAASDAAINQLIQGLQSGVVRGDEFNSIMEQAPRLAKALADGLGVTTGELRKMADAGQLTTETIIRALQSQRAALDKEFATLPATVGRAIENLRTKWTLFVGDLNSSTGATALVANGINGIADNLQELAGIAERAGVVLTAGLAVQGVRALRQLATEMGGVTGAAALLTKQLDQVPKVLTIAVAVTGFEVGYQIGQWLRENSVLARQLGVGVSEFFTGLINRLQGLKEAATALFTDDTVAAAFDRVKARAEEQRAIYEQMYAEAERAPGAIAAAAQDAGGQVAALGTTATAVGGQIAAAGSAGAAGISGVGKAAETAQEAIAALAAAATAKLPAIGAQAAQQDAAVTKLLASGQRGVALFGAELPEAISKLDGVELERFRQGMVRSLEEAERVARRTAAELQAAGQSGGQQLAIADRAAALLRTTLEAVGRQAAQSLGVDLVAAGTQVGSAMQLALDNLALLVRSLPTLKAAGVDTGRAVQQALAGMIDSARNQAEVDAVVTRLRALQAAGVLTGQQVADAMELAAARTRAIGDAADDAVPGINSLREAYRQLGLQTTEDLRQVAAASARSWELIRADTKASIATKIEAFQRYREAALAANGGVESSEVALQRRTLEAQAAVAGLGDQFQRSMGQASNATRGAQSDVRQMGESVAAVEYQLINLQGKVVGVAKSFAEARAAAQGLSSIFDPRNGRYDAQGFSLNTAGQRVVAGGQLTPPDERGAWEFVPDASYRAYQMAEQPSHVVGNVGYWKRKVPNTMGGAPGSSQDTPTATTPVPSASGAGQVITLRLGGASTTITVGSAAEAESLKTFLRGLETSAARAQGGG